MEDASHLAERKLNLERAVEWSRVEERTMTLVYEHLVPVVGVRIRPGRDEHGPGPCGERPTEAPSRAMGA